MQFISPKAFQLQSLPGRSWADTHSSSPYLQDKIAQGSQSSPRFPAKIRSWRQKRLLCAFSSHWALKFCSRDKHKVAKPSPHNSPSTVPVVSHREESADPGRFRSRFSLSQRITGLLKPHLEVKSRSDPAQPRKSSLWRQEWQVKDNRAFAALWFDHNMIQGFQPHSTFPKTTLNSPFWSLKTGIHNGGGTLQPKIQGEQQDIQRFNASSRYRREQRNPKWSHCNSQIYPPVKFIHFKSRV